MIVSPQTEQHEDERRPKPCPYKEYVKTDVRMFTCGMKHLNCRGNKNKLFDWKQEYFAFKGSNFFIVVVSGRLQDPNADSKGKFLSDQIYLFIYLFSNWTGLKNQQERGSEKTVPARERDKYTKQHRDYTNTQEGE